MIHLTAGDLLQSQAYALVNPVNTEGVMGKGIALQFKEQFPANFKAYVKNCKTGALKIGTLFTHLEKNHLIINFPTKTSWKKPSEYSYIETGLIALTSFLQENAIPSIAIPPLGCGLGGLQWAIVQKMIESHLGAVNNIDIYLYAPNDSIKNIIASNPLPKKTKLTPTRAMLLYLLFFYETLNEQASLFAANQIAYLLQRMGEPLRLDFTFAQYGVFSPKIIHVLYDLNGLYLNGLEQKNATTFEKIHLHYDKLKFIEKFIEENCSLEQKHRLKSVIDLVDGFQSAFALNLLTSLAFVLDKNETIDFSWTSNAEIQKLKRERSYKDKHLQIALERLQSFPVGAR